MKALARKPWGFMLIFLASITLLITLLVPFQTALIFYKENTNRIEMFLPVEEGDPFQLIFTHSIHLTDVVEKYEITDKKTIRQTEISFEEFAIGMPSNAQGDEQFTYEDGKYHIKNINQTFDQIKLRNGKVVSENRLVWGDGAHYRVYLNDYVEPGAWFTLKVEDITLWQYLKGVEIHE
ncbi:DUF1850 domain-containing protein [Virgibacillus pantothenticus]|uniref:RocC n=1 Tax=Virgibacillus pantothenticus TaxID=1473 RepID=A0A0L0QTD4_VIRPA|nr:DUF1850 domain-containing protein [Virgibacillus pantothenticus]KNE21443.1 hypothetical protein AFK71_07225 [Virgibacillus pantothenticus]MED3736892.1 DUF1850 domain-containing protein [Virgibacillus pantothenticus]QTY16131.1 DUF1850 domain-containing protein [Virgibacillus pantothenticus]SIS71713.1 hypothetical protein SAMN05421787_102363 [Virgibacillus pantothenticus]